MELALRDAIEPEEPVLQDHSCFLVLLVLLLEVVLGMSNRLVERCPLVFLVVEEGLGVSCLVLYFVSKLLLVVVAALVLLVAERVFDVVLIHNLLDLLGDIVVLLSLGCLEDILEISAADIFLLVNKVDELHLLAIVDVLRLWFQQWLNCFQVFVEV